MAELRYMLDTDTCIYIAREQPPQVLARLEKTPPGTVCISAITFAELLYGAAKSARKTHNTTVLRQFAESIPVLPFDDDAAWHYGEIRAVLERRGQPIGAYDTLIGAHARSAGVTLISNNTDEFRRIPKLTLANWV